MKRTFALLATMLLAIGMLAVPALAQGQSTSGNAANSLGKTTLDTDVFATETNEMDYGDGIPNGEWVTAEVQGVEIGLRAMERFVGHLGVTGTNGNRVGVYEAETGNTGDNNGTWNYEWSVDLSGATGNAEGTTLNDYSLVLEQDFTEQSLFGALGSDPVALPMVLGVCDADAFSTTLCQQSWNPGFGNSVAREGDGEGAAFDPNTERTYNLRLVLTPETFDGPPLAVAIQVNVTAP